MDQSLLALSTTLPIYLIDNSVRSFGWAATPYSGSTSLVFVSRGGSEKAL